MKKIYSLIRTSMTSDMNMYKIKTKRNNKYLVPIILTLLFMFTIWSNVNMIFEKVTPMHLQVVVISLLVLSISFMTIIEGIYKSGQLIFNCKDDQILLSLPLKKRTVLSIRIFKFYIFELKFNTLFLLPMIIAYIRWAENLNWTFFLTSFVMIIFLPIIPIIISTIIGAITTGISSRFRYKNFAQILLTTTLILVILMGTWNINGIINYIAKNATSINDFITKLYYPAGVYVNLISDFNITDLLIFILVNVIISIISIFIISKFYFKINSRIKSVTTAPKTNKKLSYEANNKYMSMIKKELIIFFKTPVFIINAGFGIVLYIILAIIMVIKYEYINNIFKDVLSSDVLSNMSIIILVLLLLTGYMTSITNSVISLEGRNINILKSLPIKIKTILLSKVLAALTINAPVILIGNIILFIKFRINIIEMILILILSILIPLVSHFIGIIINLKYPKLDAENATEVVKQSTSSLLSVMLGMILLVINILIITKIINSMSSILILVLFVIVYIVIDLILYLYLTKISIKDFEKLSI